VGEVVRVSVGVRVKEMFPGELDMCFVAVDVRLESIVRDAVS
jgi:hypothetical protein